MVLRRKLRQRGLIFPMPGLNSLLQTHPESRLGLRGWGHTRNLPSIL